MSSDRVTFSFARGQLRRRQRRGGYFLIPMLISAAISIGASYLAMALNRPKGPKPLKDDQQPSVATRGTFVPVLIGRRKMSSVVGYDGELESKKVKSGGGGSGGGSTVAGYTYKKAGVHILALGPVDTLHAIFQNSKQVFGAPYQDVLTRTGTPSGSKISVDNVGSFYIYWGEGDQPINTRGRLGAKTRWPGVCYIEWDKKELGGAIQWQQLDYEIESKQLLSPFPGTPWLERTTTPGLHKIDNEGMNPAHAVWNLLTAPSPYGAGIGSEMLDTASFVELRMLAVSEHLPVNILAEGGITIADQMTQLMSEIGFVAADIAGVLTLIMIRPPVDPTTVPEIEINEMPDALPEVQQQHGDLSPTRVVFTFPDRHFGFRTSDTKLDNDAAARDSGRQQPKSVQMYNVTDMITAMAIESRRYFEETVDGISYSLKVTRAGRNLTPGQLFQVGGIGIMRVVSKLLRWDTTVVEIEALYDQYGQLSNEDGSSDTTINVDAGSGDPEIDVVDLVGPIGGDAQIGVVRVRANSTIVGAYVWVSADGLSYLNIGSQNPYAAGGTTDRDILATEGPTIDPGPSLTPYNEDILDVADLTGNDAAWNAGAQIAIIGTEWFFVQRVEASPSGYTVRNMKRAQLGSTAADHAAGSPCLIVQQIDATIFAGGIIASGTTVHVKIQPFAADGGIISLADCPAIDVVIP